jgi:hypothetical protein
MKIIANKCPCCSAPLDLGIVRVGGECSYCDAKVRIVDSPDTVGAPIMPTRAYFDENFQLTANAEKIYSSTACDEIPMRAVDSARILAERGDICPDEQEERRNQLNAGRAPIAPGLTLEEFYRVNNTTSMKLSERIKNFLLT